MMTRKRFGIVFLILVISNFAHSQLRLPAIFSDNMVLQQNSVTPIWGWANKGESVTIKTDWLEDVIIVRANSDGKWKAGLPTIEANGISYTLTISSKTTIKLSNIVMGEVWICSGQSNMEMPVKGFYNQPVYGSNDLIALSNNPNIRQFNVSNSFTAEPQENCSGEWTLASPNTVGNYTAVGYAFAKFLNASLGVPVGIINTTWGGTPAEAWTDRQTLEEKFSEIDLSMLGSSEMKFQSPTVLYNAMIHPLIGFRIKGVIWYQGESNVRRPKQYALLFPEMIRNWRNVWQQGSFPFYFVQICPMKNYDFREQYTYLLREAQLKTIDKVPNTGIVSTLDIGAQWNIHPPIKIEIGERLAYWALNKQYGFSDIQYGGPFYESMEVIDGRAILQFSNAPNGLSDKEQKLNDFLIAGADSVFYPANAAIKHEYGIPNHKKRALVEVWSDKVKEPVAVRYGWSNWLIGSLFDAAGNPASSFRTDNWDNFKLAE